MTHDNTITIIKETMKWTAETAAEICKKLSKDIEQGNYDDIIERIVTKAEKAERGELNG